MPGGRPTNYEERFCDMLVEHMAKGFSFEAFACITDTCKDTLYEWLKVHSEFSDAKKRATEKSRYFWEANGIEGLYTTDTVTHDETGTTSVKKSLNSSIWIFNMKNRFKDEWRDKQDTDLNITGLEVIRPKSPKERIQGEDDV